MSTLAYAQTCCSGGVPVSSNIGFSSENAKTLQLSLSADINFLGSLYDNNQRLDDQLRKRTTQSYLFRGNYSFNKRISIEWFVPMVRQTREINLNNGGTDFESTFGFGDPIGMINYNKTLSPINWKLGGGLKFPFGSYTERNRNGLFLVEDLQPGSGSLDIALFSSILSTLKYRPSTSLFLRAIYKHNSSNPDSRNGLQTYKFGNDFQLIGGISDQISIFNQIITPSVSFRYRATARDQINTNSNTGTGGNWLFSKASIGLALPDDTSFTIQAEIPIYTFVNETQLSPDFILNFTFFKSFNFDNSNLIETF